MTKTRKRKKHKKVYTKKNYQSGDGMVTSVWGPPLWHYIHTMSFNYPIKPTAADKKQYKNFILSLRHVLPCRHCRDNLTKNFKALPLTNAAMKNRASFSRWVFKLHEVVNTMLGKKSGLRYCDIRERYEHFRSRCTEDKKFSTHKIQAAVKKTRKIKEKGCTEPLYGTTSKCIIKIVPKSKRGSSFQMDRKCMKKR
jgi:hypothetical protein